MEAWLHQLESAVKRGEPAVMITVVAVEGSGPREPGAKMLWFPDGRIHGTIGGGLLEKLAIGDADTVLSEGMARAIQYPLCSRTGQCCGGRVQLLFEPVGSGPRLYLFGAGHVGQAVCRVLEGTPFRVTAVDSRPEWIGSERIPADAGRWAGDWESFVDNEAVWDGQRTYALVMTHEHDLDLRVIRKILDLEFKYLGLIGSNTKWKRFSEKLAVLGVEPQELQRVTCPIGDPGTGKAPSEVAISVAAQLLKDWHVSRARRPLPERPAAPGLKAGPSLGSELESSLTEKSS